VYDITPLLGPDSAGSGLFSLSEVERVSGRGGAAGLSHDSTFDPVAGELLHLVGATWLNGALSTLLPLDSESVLYSLNDAGVAVGLKGFFNSDTEIAIVVSEGLVTDLTAAVGEGSMANGINNAGMICGWSWNSSNAFLYDLAVSSVKRNTGVNV
jgi:hypothetical protein